MRVGEDSWSPIGARSGLMGALGVAPLAIDSPPAAIAPPSSAAARSIEQRLTAIETPIPDAMTINGPRSDQPSGWGVRVRIGKLSDGSYGVERYSSAGVRTTPTWS